MPGDSCSACQPTLKPPTPPPCLVLVYPVLPDVVYQLLHNPAGTLIMNQQVFWYLLILCSSVGSKIMLAASQGQEQAGYNELLVAMTERVEKINLCCNTVVDWHDNKCRHCGNADRQSFYSPLSWMNKHVSVAALLCHPAFHCKGWLVFFVPHLFQG